MAKESGRVWWRQGLLCGFYGDPKNLQKGKEDGERQKGEQ